MDRRAFVSGIGVLGAAASLSRNTVVAGQGMTIRVRRLTWAGIQLSLGPRTIVIDPLLNPTAWQPAWTDAVVPVEVTTPQVAVLVTHLHPDHFDPAGLRTALGGRAHVVCLTSKAGAVAGAGLAAYGLNLYEPLVLPPWTIVPVPAEDGNGEEQVSWIISGGGRRFIHCGDTMWHGQWWRIGAQYGPFDIAFLPINGADLVVRRPHVDIPATMTPDQAAAAAVVLGARSVCPIHYGFNDPQVYRESPDALGTFLNRAAARRVDARVLAPGQSMELSSQ